MTIIEALRLAAEAVLAAAVVSTPAPIPTEAQRSHGEARGVATWYERAPGGAAAGPGLRNAIGKGWRGRTVTVCGTGLRPVCFKVRLDDWCACPGDRLIDLSNGDFARLLPLSRGVAKVHVRY